MAKKIDPPTRDWLWAEYRLPPEGKGRSCVDIGNELGVTKHTVHKWIRRAGIWQSGKDRRVFMRKGHPTWWIEAPNKEDLQRDYLHAPRGLGMTLAELATKYGVSDVTIRKWLHDYELTQPFPERHSQRMSGAGNPAWADGSSQNYAKRLALKIADRQECRWCGAKEDLQVHHLDHDRSHNAPGNLILLCRTCNLLESHLWILQQRGLATVRFDNDELTIRFTRKKE